MITYVSIHISNEVMMRFFNQLFAVFLLSNTCFAQSPMITAKERVSEAKSTVTSIYGENVSLTAVKSLRIFDNDSLRADPMTGRADGWSYRFYAADHGRIVFVAKIVHPVIGDRTVITQNRLRIPGVDEITPIDKGWLDTDSIFSIWRSNGLQAFMDTHGDDLEYVAGFSTAQGYEPSWQVVAMNSNDTLLCGIRTLSGKVNYCIEIITAIDPEGNVAPLSIQDIYPSPCKAGSVLAVGIALSTATDVKIEIIDLLGRRLTEIIQDHAPIGSSLLHIPIQSQYKPGIYLLRVYTPQGAVTKKIQIMN